MSYRIQSNIKLSPVGRKDLPPNKENYNKYKSFPIQRLKVNQSFIAWEEYSYGKTISIKNACRTQARRIGVPMQFAVREWRGKTRVWRIK